MMEGREVEGRGPGSVFYVDKKPIFYHSSKKRDGEGGKEYSHLTDGKRVKKKPADRPTNRRRISHTYHDVLAVVPELAEEPFKTT